MPAAASSARSPSPAASSSVPGPATPPRERILGAASRLFYAHGIKATGVDRILVEAEVAKATFYYHFPAKDDLVRAYLTRRHEQWMREFGERLARRRRPGLAPVADALGEWFADPDFHGCAFINLSTGTEEATWRAIARAHKDSLRDLLLGRIDPALPAAARLSRARRALIIVEGLIVRFQMSADPQVVTDGRALLSLLEAED